MKDGPGFSSTLTNSYAIKSNVRSNLGTGINEELTALIDVNKGSQSEIDLLVLANGVWDRPTSNIYDIINSIHIN